VKTIRKRPQTRSNDRPSNNLLRSLSAKDFDLIAPHLEVVTVATDEMLYRPGDDVEFVHFPCGPSLASYLISSEDGRDVEILLVGREGAVGAIVGRARLRAYSYVVVRFGGQFVRPHISKLKAVKAGSPVLSHLLARYAECLLAQILQSAACNALHSIEQRTAKWIISAMERTNADLLPLTHKQLAAMLGVGRSYTSRVIQAFRAEGVPETRRGSIRVQDRATLEARACLCNDAVKTHFEEVLRGVYPTGKRDNSFGGSEQKRITSKR
jgi:Crp-like helix-turn-helix domain